MGLRTFAPNPVFGLLAWGLLPILMIFADMPGITILLIMLLVLIQLASWEKEANNNGRVVGTQSNKSDPEVTNARESGPAFTVRDVSVE